MVTNQTIIYELILVDLSAIVTSMIYDHERASASLVQTGQPDVFLRSWFCVLTLLMVWICDTRLFDCYVKVKLLIQFLEWSQIFSEWYWWGMATNQTILYELILVDLSALVTSMIYDHERASASLQGSWSNGQDQFPCLKLTGQ
jgi:hypothetical protein